MEIQISGKNIDLGDALQRHVEERLSEGVEKYFARGGEASVTFTKERRTVQCDVSAHLASGVFLAAHGEGGDAYGAFDESLEKLEKRVRRHKRRLKDHHANEKASPAAEEANFYLLQNPHGDDEENGEVDDGAPVVVAESRTSLRRMTVSEAVMQLDLSDQQAIVFRNAGHGGLNVVYWRRDGHIGWVDAEAPDR